MNKRFSFLIAMLAFTLSFGMSGVFQSANASQQQVSYCAIANVRCVEKDNREKVVTDGEYYTSIADLASGNEETRIASPDAEGIMMVGNFKKPDGVLIRNVIETRAPKGYLANRELTIDLIEKWGFPYYFKYSYNGFSQNAKLAPKVPKDTDSPIGPEDYDDIVIPDDSEDTVEYDSLDDYIFYEYVRAPLLVKNINKDKKPVAGANLDLVNSNGEVVATWTSTEGIDGIDIVRPSYPYETPEGKGGGPETFTIRVKEAVKGYDKPGDVEFTLNPDGTYEITSENESSDDSDKYKTAAVSGGYNDPIEVVHPKTPEPEKPNTPPATTEEPKEEPKAVLGEEPKEEPNDDSKAKPMSQSSEEESASTTPKKPNSNNKKVDKKVVKKVSVSKDTPKSGTGSVSTGDESSMWIWTWMAVISFAVIGALVVNRRREMESPRL